MSTTPDLPPPDEYACVNGVSQPIWIATSVRTHADNCIRALTAEVAAELKAEAWERTCAEVDAQAAAARED